jgi:molecular chaperone IbpA
MCSKEAKTMKTINFPRSPMYIGFDQMFNDLERLGQQTDPGYPPYNITKVNEDKTIVELAVAGFSLPMLDIEVKDGTLSITGNADEFKKNVEYIHKGISSRKFRREFKLSEYTIVSRANLIDGILYIELVQELPETMKPKRIPINRNGDSATAEELLLG